MGYAVISALVLPTPNQLLSAIVAQRQSSGSFGKGKERFQGGWHPNSSNGREHRFTSRSDF